MDQMAHAAHERLGGELGERGCGGRAAIECRVGDDRSEAGLIQSTIKEKGRYKVIDQISVSLNEKTNSYEAIFDNLGIKKVAVDSGTIKAHPKLLVTSVWCIADVQYEFSEDSRISPWIRSTSRRPIL